MTPEPGERSTHPNWSLSGQSPVVDLGGGGLSGVDFDTALTGASTALMNVGPGLGELIGPAGNFASLSDASKWILSVGMLLGRLEFITLLVLLTPAFWRG